MSGHTFYGYTDLYHAKRRREIIGKITASLYYLSKDYPYLVISSIPLNYDGHARVGVPVICLISSITGTFFADKHPELRELMKVDPSFKYVAVACSLSQLCVGYLMKDCSFLFMIFMAVFVGPLFNCAITNSLHELVHDLAIYGSPMANKVLGNFVNIAMAWPSIGGYYRSHRNHHAYLGTDLDVKYPSMKEAESYDQNLWGRLKYIFLHPLSFGPRWEENVKEKGTDFAFWNTVTVYAADILIFFFFGYKSLLYLLISFWMNDCLFIQGSKNFVDHWVDDESTYTSSYYGPINMINFNIGYHREHHDFPNIPGRYLAAVYKMASECYADRTFIADSVFTGVIEMLKAEPGKGLTKHANKLTVKQVAISASG